MQMKKHNELSLLSYQNGYYPKDRSNKCWEACEETESPLVEIPISAATVDNCVEISVRLVVELPYEAIIPELHTPKRYKKRYAFTVSKRCLLHKIHNQSMESTKMSNIR